MLTNTAIKEAPQHQGEFAVFTNDDTAVIDHCWFRGGWFDPLTITWQTIREANTKTNDPVESGTPGASLYIPFTLRGGEEKTFRIMMVWYVPESDIRFGREPKESDKCVPGSGCCESSAAMGVNIADEAYTSGNYKPWYSSRFKGITDVGDYWKKNYDDLLKRSSLFADTFYSGTLPPEVIEAVAANLTYVSLQRYCAASGAPRKAGCPLSTLPTRSPPGSRSPRATSPSRRADAPTRWSRSARRTAPVPPTSRPRNRRGSTTRRARCRSGHRRNSSPGRACPAVPARSTW